MTRARTEPEKPKEGASTTSHPVATGCGAVDFLRLSDDIKIDESTGSVVLHSVTQAFLLGKVVHNSGLAPKGMNEEACGLAILSAARSRIDPFVALQNTAVINGRPRYFGDLPLALCRNREGVTVEEWFELDGVKQDRRPSYSKLDQVPDSLTAVCAVFDCDGEQLAVDTFSVADARLAGLWNKSGPWQTTPWRMLKFRARAFSLRDACPDTTMGFDIGEEFAGFEPEATERAPEYTVQSGFAGTKTAEEARGISADETSSTAMRAEPVADFRNTQAIAGVVKEIGHEVRRKGSAWTGPLFVALAVKTGLMTRTKNQGLGATLDQLRDESSLELVRKLRAVVFADPDPQPEEKADAQEADVEALEPKLVENVDSEPVTPASEGTVAELRQAVENDLLVTPKDLGAILSRVFKVEKVAELAEEEAQWILASLRDGSVWDHAAMEGYGE